MNIARGNLPPVAMYLNLGKFNRDPRSYTR